MSKSKQNYPQIGYYSLFNAVLVGQLLFFLNPIVSIYALITASLLGVMAYASLKPTTWVKKWSLFTGLYFLLNLLLPPLLMLVSGSTGEEITAFLLVEFLFGIPVIFAIYIYLRFGLAKDSVHASSIFYSGKEFTLSSFRNMILLVFLIIAIFVGGFWLYFKYEDSKTRDPKPFEYYVTPDDPVVEQRRRQL